MFKLPTQLLIIVLEIANVWAMILVKLDDDNTDREISNDKSEDPRESRLSSNIKEDDLENWQKVLHSDQASYDKTIRITRVPLTKKRSRADTCCTVSGVLCPESLH